MMNGHSLSHIPMGRKWIDNLPLPAMNLFIRLKAGMLGRARQTLLFLIIQGTPSSKTGHSDFFPPWFLKQTADIISFPAGERKMGNRGLILTLVPY